MAKENRTKDEKGDAVKKKCTNPISSLFMCWICPVLFKGNRRDLEQEDMIDPGTYKYQSDYLGEKLERKWQEEWESSVQKGRVPSMWRALRNTFWLEFMPSALLIFASLTARTIQPLIFTLLLNYWAAESTTTWQEASYYALCLLCCNFVYAVCNHHNSLFVGRFGLKVKVACSSLLYRKLMRLSQTSVQNVAAGKIINLMANDMARFDFAFMFMHYVWLVPIQVAVVLYFMYQAAGWSPFVGLGTVLLIIMPLQASLTKYTAVVRRRTAVTTDKRIKLMSEIINGIQVIKMYAWEIPFQKAVKLARAKELTKLRQALFIQGTFGSFMMFTERVSMFFTLLTLVLTGNIITATLIYPIQQYFTILQSNLALILPLTIANISELMVSLDRIKEFLVMDERDDLSAMPNSDNGLNNNMFKQKGRSEIGFITPKQYSKTIDTTPFIESQPPVRASLKDDHAIELLNVSASWTPEQKTLHDLTLRVRRGKLCAVIGAVGAGKSSLLQLLLRELPASAGALQLRGRVAYASQDAWLYSASVRDNILFGQPYDAPRYKQVCRVCCLLPDFKQLPYGDLSLVGERGVSLSGGQRARINLARAIYQEADIYLLDDPLSAVDANVGRELFEGCIKGYLRGRTCILVTHQIHFLKGADYIVVLKEGAIEDMGTYDDLMKSENNLSILKMNVHEESTKEDSPGHDKLNKRPSFERGVSVQSVKSDEIAAVEKEQVLAAEERASGNLKMSVFTTYITAANSWFLLFFTLFTILLTQSAATGTDYWISFWTNTVNTYIVGLPEGTEPDPGLSTQMGALTTAHFVIIQAVMVLTIITFSFIRLASFTTLAMRASANLHDLMFRNLIRAVMRFFDTNPSGRVLNRFSKDMGAMDEILPRSTLQVVQMYLAICSVLVLNAISLPWTLLPTSVIAVCFIFLLKWYLNSSQAVKRLEGTTKSPVFGKITSTISGLTTIRSSNSQQRLIKEFDECQNANTVAFYTYTGSFSAFGLYLDLMCLVYLGVVLTVFIYIDFDNLIPVGNVGLAVTQSMALTSLLQMTARFTADFLAQMTAVERVLEYTHLPSEKNVDQGPITPEDIWPTTGDITLQNVYLSYSTDESPVLKDINLQFQSGWKVGVVGRTGAGKSSLIAALFRLAHIDGEINVDGVNTSQVALQTLRSKISIIPQEPVLFSATLRYNLDPFDLYSDEEIWRALEQVELKESVTALDFQVSEGGGNFSIGQRQLLCLARALLRSNKLLVLDEATANVDPQTDALIQKTIRREFAECTVVTIAHRLNTVMDSDRVLVMEGGRVAELGRPYELLSDRRSKLSAMVAETGDAMANALLQVAKTKYLQEFPE